MLFGISYSDWLLYLATVLGSLAAAALAYLLLSVIVDGLEAAWRWFRSRGPVFDDDAVSVLRRQMANPVRPAWVASPDTPGSAVLQPMSYPDPSPMRKVTPPPGRQLAIDALAGEIVLRPAVEPAADDTAIVVPAAAETVRWWHRFRPEQHEGATLTSESPKTAVHRVTPDYTPPEQLTGDKSIALEPYGVIGATTLPPMKSIYDDVCASPVWRPLEDAVTAFGAALDAIVASLLDDMSSQAIHVEVACAHDRTEQIDMSELEALFALPDQAVVPI